MNTFSSKDFDEFWSGGIETFRAQKNHKKNRRNSQEF